MRTITALLLLAVLTGIVCPTALAEVPRTISYQGVARTTGGAPLEGEHGFTFKLYDSPDPGITTPLWQETQTIQVNGGLFDAILGSENELNLPFDAQYWLGIAIDEGTELEPRTALTSAPYALRAAYADSGGGGYDGDWIISGNNMHAGVSGNVGIGTSSPEQKLDVRGARIQLKEDSSADWVAMRTDGTDLDLEWSGGRLYVESAVDGEDLLLNPNRLASVGIRTTTPSGALAISGPEDSDLLTLQTGGTNRFALTAHSSGPDYLGIRSKLENPDSDIAVFRADGRVGIGITAPTTKLDVNGTVKATGLQMTTSPVAGHVLTSDAAGTGSWQPPGELTLPYSGTHDGNDQPSFSVTNTSTGNDQCAIVGTQTVTDGWGVGIRGEGGYTGVQGYVYPTGSDSYVGVKGRVDGGSGARYGVHGSAAGTGGGNYGVFGWAASGTGNWAVFASGDMGGTGYKSFLIDHPLDPANKYLYHYCTESPEPLNSYSGNVLLDAEGEAFVELPAYFESINREYRYQLTPLGGAMPDLHVADRIQQNRFRIAGGKSGLEVSWRVEATRHDLYNQHYGAPVEQEKSAMYRGKYLHPEFYGLPAHMGVHYQQDRRDDHLRELHGEDRLNRYQPDTDSDGDR